MEVSVENITYYYREGLLSRRKNILENFSLTIKPGESVGVFGKNGKGKTTMLQIFGKIRRPRSGIARIPKTIRIGYVPERPFYYPEMTGREFLRYLGKISKISKATVDLEVGRVSKRVDIEESLDLKIRTFSKGMLQRIGIAQALLHRPDFLILDEPTSGLDQNGRVKILDLLLSIKSTGQMMLMSSHHPADLEKVCNRIIEL